LKIVEENLKNFNYDEKSEKTEKSEKNVKNVKNQILLKNSQNSDNFEKNEKFSKLIKTFTQDISVEVYNGLNLEQDLNKNIKLPYILTNKNSLIIFDPMTESLKIFSNIVSKFFPSEFSSLTKFNLYLNSNYNIFISGGLLSNKISIPNLFSINLNNNEVKTYNNMLEGRFDHNSIIVNNKLFILGGYTLDSNGEKNCVKIFEKFNIHQNTWAKLQSCPHEFKAKPNLLNFDDEYLYIFENLINFFYYHIKNDKWTHCKPKYKGSYHLELENFTTLFYNSNVIILGGVNDGVLENYEKSINENIYHLKDGESLISKKGEFAVNDLSCKLDHGFMLDVNYLLEYSEEKKLVKVYMAKDKEIYKWNNIMKDEINEK
jgi:hypothetical protein